MQQYKLPHPLPQFKVVLGTGIASHQRPSMVKNVDLDDEKSQ